MVLKSTKVTLVQSRSQYCFFQFSLTTLTTLTTLIRLTRLTKLTKLNTTGVLVTQTAAVGGRPPLDLLEGKIFCLCSCFLDFVCLFLDTELFQASTPSLGWLVGRSVRLLDFPALALHCIVTDIKDPAKVVAMVKHVVERLQNDFFLFLAITYRRNISNQNYPIRNVPHF